MAKRILIIAGEASGDIHGAHLARRLLGMAPSLSLAGIGGDRMRKAGVNLLSHVQELGVVGVWEILPRLGSILRAYRKAADLIRRKEADLLVLIDYPGFNLRMARVARKNGVPVLYYIGPQVWAWRPGRVRTLAERVNKMIVVFPFETEIYRRAGLDCEFVGHPLLDDLPETVQKPMRSTEDQKKHYGMNPKDPVIGLFPGSRPGEVSALLPHLVSAAGDIRKDKPEAQFLFAVAPTLELEDLRARVHALSPSLASSLRWITDDAYGALQASDVVIAASGTITLQAAILLKPMVIVYRVSPLTFALARLLVRVDHVGLPNIVAGRRIVPELLQGEAHGQGIAREILRYLNNPETMVRARRDLTEVRTKLGEPGASVRAASIVLEYL